MTYFNTDSFVLLPAVTNGYFARVWGTKGVEFFKKGSACIREEHTHSQRN